MSVDASALLIYGYLEEKPGAWTEYNDPDGDDYERIGKIERELGITHGNLGDTGLRFFAIAEASYHSSMHRRLDIVTIEPQELAVKPEYNEKLKQFAEAVGVDTEFMSPVWFLVAYWD